MLDGVECKRLEGSEEDLCEYHSVHVQHRNEHFRSRQRAASGCAGDPKDNLQMNDLRCLKSCNCPMCKQFQRTFTGLLPIKHVVDGFHAAQANAKRDQSQERYHLTSPDRHAVRPYSEPTIVPRCLLGHSLFQTPVVLPL